MPKAQHKQTRVAARRGRPRLTKQPQPTGAGIYNERGEAWTPTAKSITIGTIAPAPSTILSECEKTINSLAALETMMAELRGKLFGEGEQKTLNSPARCGAVGMIGDLRDRSVQLCEELRGILERI